MCKSDGYIKLQVHWQFEANVPYTWHFDKDREPLTVIKIGFDTYCGIPVYVVSEPITLRLIKNALVFGEKHFKERVECLD